MCTLKAYHDGGIFDEDDIICYVRGEVIFFDWVDNGYLAYRELEDLATEIGYKGNMDYYFKDPTRHRFYPITSNHEIVQMFDKYYPGTKINVYFNERPKPLQNSVLVFNSSFHNGTILTILNAKFS